MQYSTKSSSVDVAWSGVTAYTLTGSDVASDAINTEFCKRFTVYPSYKAGATETGNTANLTIEYNPYDEISDKTGAYWFPIGNYTDSSGTWSEESAVYNVAQGTAGSYRNGIPVSFDQVNALRIRVKAKETGVASNYGTLKLIIVKNEIT